MKSPKQSATPNAPRHALRALELFSLAARVAFDRVVAARVLTESERVLPGNSPDVWARRLIEVGESVNLRIRGIECTLLDALSLARDGSPVTLLREHDDQAIEWFVIHEARGRRFLLWRSSDPSESTWLNEGQLRDELGLRPGDPAKWILGQPALACESAAREDSPGPQYPLSRLIDLVRPEKKDLWVVLIFSLIVGVLALATPIAVEALVNTVAFGRYLQPVVVLALMLLTFLGFAAGMRASIAFVVEIFQRRLFIRVIEDLAYRLPRIEQEQFDHKYGPETVNRFFDIATVQKTASALLLDGISIVLQTVIGMAVLGFYHPFLLGFDVLLLASIGFIVFVLGRGAVPTAVKESKAKYAVAAWLQELARHPTAFKLHSGNQFALDRADQLAIAWLDRRRVHFRVVIRQILFALGLQAVAATALLGLGGWLVILGELTLGQLVAAELIVMMIVGSFAKLGKHMESFYDLLASTDKLGQLFDLRIEPHDKLFHLREGQPAALGIYDAEYKYESSVGLAKVRFDVQPGESVALVGPPGSGKSTMLDLLCGLRSPTAGRIELDNIDLRELRPDSLREHLAMARGVEIFAGTIEENVHLNRPDIRADDVRDALDMVGLLDEVLQSPNGLNTQLVTHGAPLSHSQAVRLMLARAIVARPRLLLIDGALDSLPDDMLESLLARLDGERNPWTLIVVSGRRQVIESCERVVHLATPTSAASGADHGD